MKKTEVVQLRAETRKLAAWRRRAAKHGMKLSEFLRCAADTATANLATDPALKDELLQVRSAMNLAQHVRTAEMKNLRIEDALTIINRTLEAI